METGEKFLSQKDFAAHRGVQKGTVSKWKAKGILVLDNAGRVDVEASEWKLDGRPAVYRGGITHRPVPGPDMNNHHDLQTVRKPKRKPNEPAAIDADDDGAPNPLDFDLNNPTLTQAEAVRRKENFLGLLRKHEFEVANRQWVRVEDVGKSVEREYSTVRKRLLAIPGKLAAKLVGLDRAAIDLVLFEEISEALSELHAPDPEDGFGVAA